MQIAQEFAGCIGLPDGTIVQVRALPNVPKASLVTIEPAAEDDWEVVELNAESAEAAILNQVFFFLHKNEFFMIKVKTLISGQKKMESIVEKEKKN